jgi:pimeloyl-ACP methyl ester carboxylesterase
VLWPEHDPIFPRAWSDRLGEFFSDVRLVHADGVGHFTPVEAPDRFAELVNHAATATTGAQSGARSEGGEHARQQGGAGGQ